MISCIRITDGVPRAPKAAACWDVLRECVSSKKGEKWYHERAHKVIRKVRVIECTCIGTIGLAPEAAGKFEHSSDI